MTARIHVVGGGLAGLVAAITAAEQGVPVVLHEATAELGGRARGGGRAGLNLGPHVLFTDGALWRWTQARRLVVPVRRPPASGIRVVDDDGVHRPLVQALRLAPTVVPASAPIDATFRSWATARFGTSRGGLLCRFAGLGTYHHDPGSLSAAFVWERYRRAFLRPDRVRYVVGGWTTLVEVLAARATELGVSIRTGSPVGADADLDGPVVVATSLDGAGRLLGRPLAWPGARTALVDVALAQGRPLPYFAADVRTDLASCVMVDRAVHHDPSALLYQAQLGVGPEVTLADGVARIERTLDAALPSWRERTVWRRELVSAQGSGAVDLPGTTWHDRPPVDQGDDRFLAGDAVAAPGMLSEVSVNSAVGAARLAVAASRRRAFAPGWPNVDLTPARRLAVLAEVLPGAMTGPAPSRPRPVEPVDETGPGYQLRRLGPMTVVSTTEVSTTEEESVEEDAETGTPQIRLLAGLPLPLTTLVQRALSSGFRVRRWCRSR